MKTNSLFLSFLFFASILGTKCFADLVKEDSPPTYNVAASQPSLTGNQVKDKQLGCMFHVASDVSVKQGISEGSAFKNLSWEQVKSTCGANEAAFLENKSKILVASIERCIFDSMQGGRGGSGMSRADATKFCAGLAKELGG